MTNTESPYVEGHYYQTIEQNYTPEVYRAVEVHETHTVLEPVGFSALRQVDFHDNPEKHFEPVTYETIHYRLAIARENYVEAREAINRYETKLNEIDKAYTFWHSHKENNNEVNL